MPTETQPAKGLSRAEYAAIAAFRYQLRRFLAFSEAAAAGAGLPAQQHQALLAIAGQSSPLAIGGLAEQLLIAPHTAAELVSRMVEAGLLVKIASLHDRRRMELALTAQAESLLSDLTAAHIQELQTLEPALVRALRRVSRQAEI